MFSKDRTINVVINVIFVYVLLIFPLRCNDHRNKFPSKPIRFGVALSRNHRNESGISIDWVYQAQFDTV